MHFENLKSNNVSSELDFCSKGFLTCGTTTSSTCKFNLLNMSLSLKLGASYSTFTTQPIESSMYSVLQSLNVE